MFEIGTKTFDSKTEAEAFKNSLRAKGFRARLHPMGDNTGKSPRERLNDYRIVYWSV